MSAVAFDVGRVDFAKGDGLVPAIVQDATTGAVLMLGYMNREALEETLKRQRAVFYSRGKQRLWEKGETTGHTLDLVDVGHDAFSVAIACRGSEELIFERRAKQAGPKSGTVTTFDGATRVLVWRTTKYVTDVYSCTSTAERDPAPRCKALVDAVMSSTIVRRGTAAFARPKS